MASDAYQIVTLAVDPEACEELGTKEKFWFDGSGIEAVQRLFKGSWFLLFKAATPGTGEDWAEKIVCELCELLGLPHVQYEMAVIAALGKRGVICPSFVPAPDWLVHGNELLFTADPDYPASGAAKYRVREHTVEAVVEVLRRIQPPPAPAAITYLAGIHSALDYFVGYVLLDAWVANQDRHHENWAGMRVNEMVFLAPTFDHGAALARNIRDDERQRRLTTRDRNSDVAAFSAKARSAFYLDAAQRKTMTTFAAWKEFAKYAPESGRVWLERLARVDDGAVREIIARVPAERMSDVAKAFTRQLLSVNRQRLLDEAGQ